MKLPENNNNVDKLKKNIGILSIGTFSSKILVFLLVPLYTNVLSTEEYGSFDLINTTISLLFPIVSLNITVSTQRFLLDNESNKRTIIQASAKYVVFSVLVSVFIVILNSFLCFSAIINQYKFYFLCLYFATALNALLTECTIGLDKLKHLAISGVISTFTTIGLNVLFLLIINWGIDGYFLATILGTSIQSVYLICLVLKVSLFKNGVYDKKIEKRMLQFSMPQIANNVSWWINNASDRYIVTYFCGLDNNGIYSVAYKIPAILNMLGGIFSQATTICIVQNFNDEDRDVFFTQMYRIYNLLLVVFCSVIILFTKLIAKIMYAKDFYEAWKYAPLLLIASMFGAISGYLGGVFSAKLDAKEFSKSTVIGASVNICLNIVLVPFMGVMGAAIATCISYITIWLIRLTKVKKYIYLKINFWRDVFSYLILFVQGCIFLFVKNCYWVYFIEILLILALLYVNYKEAKFFINTMIFRKRNSV